jgi:flavin-dependent dehydrogenase
MRLWIPVSSLTGIAEKHDLNVQDYMFWRSKKLVIEYKGRRYSFPIRGLCTFDKLRFMHDLHVDVQYNYTVAPQDAPKRFDYIVDATGSRELLGHLPNDKTYVCYQVKARFDELPVPDFYMKSPRSYVPGLKYLWLFPLSTTEAYVGCGAYYGSEAAAQVNDFLTEHGGVVLEKQAKKLRVNPPHESLPFHKIVKNRVIVGVGGSVGAISSFGEGNEPSAMTAELLAKNICNLPRYEEKLVDALSWLKRDYQFYDSINNGSTLKLLYKALRKHGEFRRRWQVPLIPLSF